MGQTYAISKAISFPRLKKKGWQNGSESESIFFELRCTLLFWQTCVMQYLSVMWVRFVCLVFVFVLDKF